MPGFSDNNLPLFKRYQPIVWQLFEEPRSSNPAKVVALVQVTMIVLSIVILWITTYPFSRYQVIEMQNQFNIIPNTNLSSSSNKMITSIRIIDSYLHPFLVSLEYITLAWFLIDFIIRFTVSPDKAIFMTQFNNVIDIIASLLVIINPFIQAYIAPGHD